MPFSGGSTDTMIAIWFAMSSLVLLVTCWGTAAILAYIYNIGRVESSTDSFPKLWLSGIVFFFVLGLAVLLNVLAYPERLWLLISIRLALTLATGAIGVLLLRYRRRIIALQRMWMEVDDLLNRVDARARVGLAGIIAATDAASDTSATGRDGSTAPDTGGGNANPTS
jgi:hypothetical protein